MRSLTEIAQMLSSNGYILVPNVLTPERLQHWRTVFNSLNRTAHGVFHRESTVYAARNVLQLAPETRFAADVAPLPEILKHILGPSVGLVRALFFDKPPGQTWALPWHKDLKIAVRPNPPASNQFSPPRDRSGVLHAEAPLEVLTQMLTVRMHLDDMTPANGPLEVLPGSHLTGKAPPQPHQFAPRQILGQAGDVLLMRPLLAHCSSRSHESSQEHRRILHLEFSASPTLPDGWHWHDFFPVGHVP